jgi:hypothetical protein
MTQGVVLLNSSAISGCNAGSGKRYSKGEAWCNLTCLDL